jgi:hypothetical protein
MSHSQKITAVVLKTYNVGEADRYCVLFSLEKGRLAARASGVRKIGSRMGGSLLPFCRVRAEIKESAAGWILAGVESAAEGPGGSDLAAFSASAQGIELLLRLTQDDEPLPDVYASLLLFLRACGDGLPHVSLVFSIRLLHLLGFLPGEEEMEDFFQLDATEREFLHAAREGIYVRGIILADVSRVEALRDRFLRDQLTSPLKAPGVAARMRP